MKTTMIKTIFKCFLALTMVSFNYAQANPTNAHEQHTLVQQQLGKVFAVIEQYESKGYVLQDTRGQALTFNQVRLNPKILGRSFSVLSPATVDNGRNLYRLKLNVDTTKISSGETSLKVTDDLDQTVLGRTTIKLPQNAEMRLESELAIQSLSVQVMESLKSQNKMARNESTSQKNVVTTVFEIFFPKAHAGLNNAFYGFIAGFSGIMMFAVGVILLITIAQLGFDWIDDSKTDMNDLKRSNIKALKIGVVFAVTAGFCLMIVGLGSRDRAAYP
ncbi:MAG: hypothetical protein JNL11_07930 [Bdellovibrionaceae bacterium]|nr:hypothetical protein [Pseudobdellovibrionaceae bacterium]